MPLEIVTLLCVCVCERVVSILHNTMYPRQEWVITVILWQFIKLSCQEQDIFRHGGLPYLSHHCELQKAFDPHELVYQEGRVGGWIQPRVVKQVWGSWCEEDDKTWLWYSQLNSSFPLFQILIILLKTEWAERHTYSYSLNTIYWKLKAWLIVICPKNEELQAKDCTNDETHYSHALDTCI